MLGAFVAYMAVVWWGLDYWLAFLISVVTIGVFGALLDAVILRNVIGQPQFMVVMLTIGGSMFHLRQRHLGFRDLHLPAVQRRLAADRQGDARPPVPVRSSPAPWSCAACSMPSSTTRIGVAMHGRLAESARCLLHGHPGQADLLDDLGDLGRRGRGRRHPVGPVT